jgi:hypothetical protein
MELMPYAGRMNRDTMTLRLAMAAAALAGLLTLTGQAAAQVPAPDAPAPAEAGVTVPNFWDPRARLERPAARDIGPIRFLTSEIFRPSRSATGAGC